MNEMKHNEKKTGKIFFFIGVGIILILLLIAEFISRNGLVGQAGPKTQVQEQALKSKKQQESEESRRRALENIIRQETEQYLNRNWELQKEFELKIASAGNADFELARKNIPAVAGQFSSIAWNGKLC